MAGFCPLPEWSGTVMNGKSNFGGFPYESKNRLSFSCGCFFHDSFTFSYVMTRDCHLSASVYKISLKAVKVKFGS